MRKFGRREALGLLAGFSAGAISTNGDAQGQKATLQSAAARLGLFYGAAVRLDQLDAEPDLCAVVLEECSYLTPEIALKWAEIEPSRGQLSLNLIDDLAAFAASNGKKIRGHTLLWHRSVPQWSEALLRETKDWRLISRYFSSVIPRYGNVIDQWDVVNEPIAPGDRSDGLRNSVFLEAFGPDYIARGLREARTFTPHARLMINEFGLEYDKADERARRYHLLKLLESLRKSGVPLDGVGVQAHLDLRKGSISPPAIVSFLDELVDLGLFFVITELDVKEAAYTASPEERDRLVADEAARYLDVVLHHKGLAGVATWGLSDRHSWLQVAQEDYARFPGAWSPGQGPGLNRGLPFDSDMRRKPMYYAMLKSMQSARPLYGSPSESGFRR